MLERRRTYLRKLSRFRLWLFIFGAVFVPNISGAEEEMSELLILEPVVQSYNMQDYAYAYEERGKIYISLPQMSLYTGLKTHVQNGLLTIVTSGDGEDKVTVDTLTHTIRTAEGSSLFDENDIQIFDETLFLTTELWSKILGAEVSVDKLNMMLLINREKDFPTIIKLKAEKKRSKGLYDFKSDGFENYEFDERWLGDPVLDLSFGKGWGHSNGGRTFNSDSYSANLAMLAGGLDINAYFAGDSYSDRKPRIRLSGSRTFLDEPPNALNLKTLKLGDINGINNSYFTNAGYGRGAAVSSFKNLVMSANKTIDITGPLTDGWQVELYWNEQLVGFRQNGVNGQYNFPNIPVSYGLNVFKLVFYGPYGEVRTEYERYYSGTSPVKKGEFGYNMAAYQPYRYLFENNEPFKYEGKDIPIVDMTGYYGATDKLTLMGGFTQTPDAETLIDTQHFGMAGAQMAVQGSSVQYNLEQNLDTQKVGHHAEWQGDVYIGNIYAGYDKYNGIHSPISYYGQEYLDEQLEARLSGMLPYSVPYYLSWREGKLENDGSDFTSFSARLSKQILYGLNLTVEDNYYNYQNASKPNNTLRFGAYKWWGKFSSETWLEYETSPETRFTEFSTRLDWRTGRNTYVSGKYTRNIQEEMDYFSLSGGHIFPFGGLTASLETDRNWNLSAYLTYNISLAKTPDRAGIITSANSKLSQSGTIYAKVYDENGNPLEGIGLNANGLEKEVYTDKYGTAVLTDLQTYEKTILNVDTETLLDIALQPTTEEKKLVLHPGTIRTVEIPFIHRGAVEGKLANDRGIRMFGYKIAAVNGMGAEKGSTYADIDGYFILDNVPYGTYKLIVSKDDFVLAELQDVKIDDTAIFIPDEIVLDWKGALFFEDKDSEKELETLEEEHEKGFNSDEYINNTFPIDIPAAVEKERPDMMPLRIEDIEGDIFAKDEQKMPMPAKISKPEETAKPVAHPYQSYSMQEIEKLIFEK